MRVHGEQPSILEDFGRFSLAHNWPKDFVFCAGVIASVFQLVNLTLFGIVQKSASNQMKTAKRNAYVRTYILGHGETTIQDQ